MNIEVWTRSLPIIIMILLIIFLIIGIVLGIKAIIALDKAEKVIDNVNEKIQSLILWLHSLR